MRQLQPAEPGPAPVAELLPQPQNFEAVVALFEARGEPMLRTHLAINCHLVRFEPGRLEIRPSERAPRDLANRVGNLLSSWTDRRWVVSIASEGGAPTLYEQERHAEQQRHEWALAHPVIAAYLAAFPGATVEAMRPAEPALSDAVPAEIDYESGDGEPSPLFDEEQNS